MSYTLAPGLTVSRYSRTPAYRSPLHTHLTALSHRPVALVPKPAPVPALVVETPNVRVAATEGALDRILRAFGEVVRDVAPYALGAFVVHRFFTAVENSSRR